MVGLGPWELIILAAIAGLAVLVPLCIVVVLVVLNRRQAANPQSPTYDELLAENRSLRAELAAGKNKPI